MAQSALVLAVTRATLERAGFEELSEPAICEVSRFVENQIERMPLPLRVGMKGVTQAFAASAFAGYWQPFARLPSRAQAELLDRWATSPLGIARDFVRFYRSLCIVAAESLPANAQTR